MISREAIEAAKILMGSRSLSGTVNLVRQVSTELLRLAEQEKPEPDDLSEWLRVRFCDVVPGLTSRSWEDIWERVRNKFRDDKPDESDPIAGWTILSRDGDSFLVTKNGAVKRATPLTRPDDSEPITAEWFGWGELRVNWAMRLGVSVSNCAYLRVTIDMTEESLPLPHITTRGQLRSLWKSLTGQELEERT